MAWASQTATRCENAQQAIRKAASSANLSIIPDILLIRDQQNPLLKLTARKSVMVKVPITGTTTTPKKQVFGAPQRVYILTKNHVLIACSSVTESISKYLSKAKFETYHCPHFSLFPFSI